MKRRRGSVKPGIARGSSRPELAPESLRSSIEYHLIAHCAPTLANLKVSGLFNYTYDDGSAFIDMAYRWNQMLKSCGLALEVVKMTADKALVYCYRPEGLKRILDDREIKSFLNQFDYNYSDCRSALNHLIARLAEHDEFPHEIGIFLGYPLGDVRGFIANRGQNCTACRYWKVYENAEQTEVLFEQFNRCKREYLSRWLLGESLISLAC